MYIDFALSLILPRHSGQANHRVDDDLRDPESMDGRAREHHGFRIARLATGKSWAFPGLA